MNTRSPISQLLSSRECDTLVIPIAGFQYYDGNEALPELQADTSLTLRAQPDNPHDPFAVEILHGRGAIRQTRRGSVAMDAKVSDSATTSQSTPHAALGEVHTFAT